MSDESPQPTALVPIATKVVYEDERVRVWDQVIEPGKTTGPHRHELPYALVTVEGASLDVDSVPGYDSSYGTETLSITVDDQTAAVIPGGSVEDARNTGDRTYRAILVEFKQG